MHRAGPRLPIAPESEQPRIPNPRPPALITAFVLLALSCATGWGCAATSSRGEILLTVDRREGGRDSAAVAPATASAPQRVTLAGLPNETLDFRLTLQVASSASAGVSIEPTPLVSAHSSIDASFVRVFRMHRVPASRLPGWHIRSIPPAARELEPWDVLVPIDAPRGGIRETLAAGSPLPFWVDVAIPGAAAAGTYAGEVRVLLDKSIRASVRIELTVAPVLLPDDEAVPIIADVDHRALLRHHLDGFSSASTADAWGDAPEGARADVLIQSTLRMLREHRLTPVLPLLSPASRIDKRGDLVLDWSLYDSVVEPCLDGRLFRSQRPLSLWPLPVHGLFRAADGPSFFAAEGSARLRQQFLAQCAWHFDAKGWLKRGYAPLSEDNATPRGSPGFRAENVRAIRGADPRIPIMSRFWPQDMTSYGWSDGAPTVPAEAVDIWSPPAQFYDAAAMAGQRAAGRRTWIGVDRPPFGGTTSIHAPATYLRVIPWQARRLAAQAVRLGWVNDWPAEPRRSTPTECIGHHDGPLLYPGRPFGLEVPVTSVRLKHLRRGVQDAAYWRLLDEHGLGAVGERVSALIAGSAGTDAYRAHFADGRPIGWTDDVQAFELARHVMAEALTAQALGGRQREPKAAPTPTTAERRLQWIAGQPEMYFEGARVRPVREPPGHFEVEAHLTISNRGTESLFGELQLPDSPPYWSQRVVRPAELTLRGMGSRRVTITALSPSPAGIAGSVVAMAGEFVASDQRRAAANIRVCAVVATPFRGPIEIDGDLSDWPPGAENVAPDFKLVVPPPMPSGDDATRRPTHETLAFVMRDSRLLYLAVNSRHSGRVARMPAAGNRVAYDDLVPTGDELVEVLFDPLNSGTRSPGDLYHIAVKPSGTYNVERGIRFDPPCGRREPWPVDLEVATAVTDDRWTVELRIPLDSFDAPAIDGAVWGFNVLRFDADRQEFSTWSGAIGNAYDPLSLGNLYLP